MYARVARFEGAQGDALRREADDISSRAASGPPEGDDAGKRTSVETYEVAVDIRG